MDAQTRLVKMMAAMQYAGLVGLLALTSRPPRSPKPERRCLTAIPLTTVSRTTVGSAEEQKVYCEGWRAFRKDW